jgi:hypothetical protein
MLELAVFLFQFFDVTLFGFERDYCFPGRLFLYAPWHFLYFFPLPQGHGSLRPILPGAMVRAACAAAGARPFWPR